MLRKMFHAEPCIRGPSPPYRFCGQCYENIRGRANHKGHLSHRSRPKQPYIDWSTYVKRTSQASPDPKDRKWECPDAWFRELYPTLAQGMCDPWWDDGKPRDLWTLKIVYGPRCCDLTLNDKGAKLVLFTSGQSLDASLGAVEAALQEGTAAWRKSKF